MLCPGKETLFPLFQVGNQIADCNFFIFCALEILIALHLLDVGMSLFFMSLILWEEGLMQRSA